MASMSNKEVTVILLYPKQSDSTFDMAYYLASHMPLVQERWSSLGLHDWTVLHFEVDDAPYRVQTSLEFDTMAGFEKASKDTNVFDEHSEVYCNKIARRRWWVTLQERNDGEETGTAFEGGREREHG
ncbi:hypothetical protein MMC28_005652 [Mycoblastus sanguinarius]|nr:hypothetical protein [Mycoblastus sanguinarius]